jgi:acyl-CoA reductase-like NAD-dependent aldehyde dehydrogenase
MLHRLSQIYVGGAWHAPLGRDKMAFENPATGAVLGQLSLGGAADADRAVMAARGAFDGF